MKQILFVFFTILCLSKHKCRCNRVADKLPFTDFSMLSCVYVRQNTNVIETMCFLLSFSLAFSLSVSVGPRSNCGVLQVKCPLTVFPVDFYFFCTP